MESALLDTDVFSFFFNRDSRRRAYARVLAGRRLCLSFMSVAELKQWAILRKWNLKRRQRLVRAIRRCLILPFDDEMTDYWAQISAHRQSIGRPISCGDCWIAASALRHDIPLATHNRQHFSEIPGLQLMQGA